VQIFDDLIGLEVENYFTRNDPAGFNGKDPVIDALDRIHAVTPLKSVLEIGCGTGRRLNTIETRFGARASGIDASQNAVKFGKKEYPHISLQVGLAPGCLENLISKASFDCIVLGFFMYLIPRERVFRLAAYVDELLEENGHLVISDFLTPTPSMTSYGHDERLNVYKYDPSGPWKRSPNYCEIERMVYHSNSKTEQMSDISHWTTVDVLRKLPNRDVM